MNMPCVDGDKRLWPRPLEKYEPPFCFFPLTQRALVSIARTFSGVRTGGQPGEWSRLLASPSPATEI